MQFLLVEPIAKTPYPPLGLMKISSMLKDNHPNCKVFDQIGNSAPNGLYNPEKIFITSLFTWDVDSVIDSIRYYQRKFPGVEILVGGISATLIPEYITKRSGIIPRLHLYEPAEFYPPDYSVKFGRKLNTSMTMASRGCIRKCSFCTVTTLEPNFYCKNNWEKDINIDYPYITFWDNNWLASSNFESDIEKLIKFGKKVDFNQGLDARLYDEQKAKLLSKINIDPIRFAFDDISYEKQVIKAIRTAKKYTNREIAVYVLYNHDDDTPEELYYRLNLLNNESVLVFPMEYREPTPSKRKFPAKNWNTYLLRGFKLSTLFYYRKGMITAKRESFTSIYGNSAQEFVNKLYKIYDYDKNLKRKKR